MKHVYIYTERGWEGPAPSFFARSCIIFIIIIIIIINSCVVHFVNYWLGFLCDDDVYCGHTNIDVHTHVIYIHVSWRVSNQSFGDARRIPVGL